MCASWRTGACDVRFGVWTIWTERGHCTTRYGRTGQSGLSGRTGLGCPISRTKDRGSFHPPQSSSSRTSRLSSSFITLVKEVLATANRTSQAPAPFISSTSVQLVQNVQIVQFVHHLSERGPSNGESHIAGSGPFHKPFTDNLASPSRTNHILFGDSSGGGHLYPGGEGKSLFPKSWSGDKIRNYISDIATDPKIQWEQISGRVGAETTKSGLPVRHQAIGIREGIKIKVIIEPTGEGIITGYPIP